MKNFYEKNIPYILIAALVILVVGSTLKIYQAQLLVANSFLAVGSITVVFTLLYLVFRMIGATKKNIWLLVTTSLIFMVLGSLLKINSIQPVADTLLAFGSFIFGATIIYLMVGLVNLVRKA
ncbi:MAG: hypothetical protein Q4F57_03135 [Weeksellaceae bacterium]|nr:hypothetical protein [Weeksellaceae bacterium]